MVCPRHFLWMYFIFFSNILKIFRIPVLICTVVLCSSWGFFAHRQINNHAVFSLPKGMIRFYKSNIDFVTAHAVDPDKRRYVDTMEAPRHFLDVDRYGINPFDHIPEKWKAAVAKYSENTLKKNGIVPWQIEKSYYALVKAFQARDSLRILRLSADNGHYIADAHVPLHTTENYNGQLTNQVGIHGLWESRLPELFADQYDYIVGKVKYIKDPLREAWKIIRHTFHYKDSVLMIEANLSKQFPADKKCSFSKRKGKLVRNYSRAYCRAYHAALNGMVERQMRASILAVASFWYSAWVDAGQPNLANFSSGVASDQERKHAEKEEQCYKKGRIIGREEEH